MTNFIDYDSLQQKIKNKQVDNTKQPVADDVAQIKTEVKPNPPKAPKPAKTSKTSSPSTLNEPTVKKRPRISSSTAFIKDFPKSLLEIAQAEFPRALNQTDALSAYVAVKSGQYEGVSPEVAELIKAWGGDDSISSMNDRIANLEKQVSTLTNNLENISLGVSYLIFDYMGYRREDAPSDILSINFLEDGVADLQTRLDVQTKQLRAANALRNGRPKY